MIIFYDINFQRGASVNLTRPMTNAVVAQRFEVIFITLFVQQHYINIRFRSIQSCCIIIVYYVLFTKNILLQCIFFITDNSYQLSMRFLAVLQIFEIECKIEISKMFATVPNIMRKEHMRYYAFPQN